MPRKHLKPTWHATCCHAGKYLQKIPSKIISPHICTSPSPFSPSQSLSPLPPPAPPTSPPSHQPATTRDLGMRLGGAPAWLSPAILSARALPQRSRRRLPPRLLRRPASSPGTRRVTSARRWRLRRKEVTLERLRAELQQLRGGLLSSQLVERELRPGNEVRWCAGGGPARAIGHLRALSCGRNAAPVMGPSPAAAALCPPPRWSCPWLQRRNARHRAGHRGLGFAGRWPRSRPP